MTHYERKVTKIGNSYGVTFPKELLKEAGISYGDKLQLEQKDGNIVVRKQENISLPEGVDSSFIDLLNDVIKEHDTAFKGLVQKWN